MRTGPITQFRYSAPDWWAAFMRGRRQGRLDAMRDITPRDNAPSMEQQRKALEEIEG